MIGETYYYYKMKNQRIKNLTPGKKLELALNLYFNARELKAAAIRKNYPELSEKEVKEKVKEIFLYAKS
jgi:hypothetical protein